MKKLFLNLFLVIVCLSLFTVLNNNTVTKQKQENPPSNPEDGWILKLAPDTEHFANVFFATENLGCIYKGTHPVKRTTDGGNTWGYGSIPAITTTIGGVYFNGTSIFMAGYLSLPGDYFYDLVFRSSNMGLNWDTARSAVNGGPPPGNHYYFQFYNMYKMVGFMRRNFIAEPDRTKNGGYGWTTIVMPGNLVPEMISYVDINCIYGTFSSGIGRCINPALNFTIIKNGSFSKICVVDSNNILATQNMKLFRSTDAGASWDSSFSFPVLINSISFPDQNTGYVTGNNGKIFKSSNKGATWVTQVTPNNDNLIDCWFLNSQTGYVIGYNGTLLKTNSGGNSAFSVSGFARYSDNNEPVTSGTIKAFKLDKITSDIIIYDTAIIQSNGSYTLPNVPQDSVDIGVFPNSTPPNDWVVTYYPSTIYWEKATVLYPTGNLTNININAIRLAASTNSNSVNGKVMRLNDNPVLANLKDAVLYAKNGNNFVKCGISDVNGIYHLNSLPAGSLKIIATRLGFTRDSTTVNVTSSSNTDSINFYLNRYTVGIKNISNTVPSEYKLFQNYPNPFNPATIIRFQMKDSRFVTLKVYDILGKEIVTLVNEKLNAGEYEIQFSINQIPSGIYFYKLESGDFTATKKMVLVK
jgi:hypothetical protein